MPSPAVPKIWDIVYARIDFTDVPGNKFRYCLVTKITPRPEKPPAITLVPGTSQSLHIKRPGEFVINNPDSMKRLGLWKPTKFSITNATHVALTENSFVPCPRTAKNIVGKLTENELRLLHRAAGEYKDHCDFLRTQELGRTLGRGVG
jgi:hypothetical protein